MLAAVLVVVNVAAASGCAARRAPLPLPDVGRLDVQGHRGCRGLLPENSLPAFERALELGVSTLELDLQVTRDRVLVVHHDQRLDSRRCVYDDGSAVPERAIRDLPAADLATIDCGRRPDRRFPGQRAVPGTRIPRFGQVLELARRAPYPVRLNVEIKLQRRELGIPPDEFAALVVAAVRRAGLQGRTTVQSFRPEALRAVGRLAPELALAILVERRRDYERRLRDSGASILSPAFRGLRRGDVRRLRARGIPVIPWTVNDPGQMRRLIRWGVDGIISDYPDRVQAVLADLAGFRDDDRGTRYPEAR